MINPDEQAMNSEKTIEPPAIAVSLEDLTRTKNSNPGANTNIENSDIDTGAPKEVGSEITDGDGG